VDKRLLLHLDWDDEPQGAYYEIISGLAALLGRPKFVLQLGPNWLNDEMVVQNLDKVPSLEVHASDDGFARFAVAVGTSLPHLHTLGVSWESRPEEWMVVSMATLRAVNGMPLTIVADLEEELRSKINSILDMHSPGIVRFRNTC
jgi:hypothetical protein